MVLGACACWGLDNAVTARIDHLAPEHIVALKGFVAGSMNLALGASLSGFGSRTALTDVGLALVLGAAGYGLSIALWVKGARDLGAARGQVVFATAPFIGAVLAWTVFGEHLARRQVIAGLIAAAGVVLALGTDHEHRHQHRVVVHEHEHPHDDGHHDHHDSVEAARHTHAHRHEPASHSHRHVPDLHHGHRHDGG